MTDTHHLHARFRRRELDTAAEQAVARAVRNSTSTTTAPTHPNGRDPADARLLRGIPCLAPGVGGTSPGTRPDRITQERDLAVYPTRQAHCPPSATTGSETSKNLLACTLPQVRPQPPTEAASSFNDPGPSENLSRFEPPE